MKPGDRVVTPGGPGAVLRCGSSRSWVGPSRSRPVGWVYVRLDDENEVRRFLAVDVKPEPEPDAS